MKNSRLLSELLFMVVIISLALVMVIWYPSTNTEEKLCSNIPDLFQSQNNCKKK